MDSIYTIHLTKTTCHADGPISGDDILAFISNKAPDYNAGFAVCRLYHAVHFGRIIADDIVFYPGVSPDYSRDLNQLRLFSETGELLIWRKGSGQFMYRIRKDGVGDIDAVYVEAEQILWGTNVRTPEPGWVELFEDRGIRLVIPSDIVHSPEGTSTKLNNRYILKTRNYIEYNQIGQAGYVDCRFVALALED